MTPVKKLDFPWLTSKPLVRLLKSLNTDGLNARMVGGCVRDALLGRDITDIDLACCLSPAEVMARLGKAGIKVVPTGLKHGTVTAVMGKSHFEVTTLRRDVETDGRHARVAFTDDWAADARRRDFTLNALYLDGDGNLYDPCGGLDDVTARRVRFIGDGDQRITEDALRILRFFRFTAQVGDGKLDRDGFAACIRNKDMIDKLSGERLAQEIYKTIAADDVLAVIKIMAESGILAKILPDHRNLEQFNDFVRLENDLGRCDILARLACLLTRDVSRHLKLSNKQAKILCRYMNHDVIISSPMTERQIRKNIYHNGRDVFIFALLQKGVAGEALTYAENWPLPQFPVQGRDVMAAGLFAGPEVGALLKKLEAYWVDSDFMLSKEALLAL